MYWGSVPVKVQFSYGTQDQFNFTIICLRSQDVRGWGETLSHPDDLAKGLIPELIGQDAMRLDGILAGRWRNLQPWIHELFSMALYNLVCQAREVPLHTLLCGQRRASVPLMPCLFPRSADEARQLAEKWIRLGFKHLKTKIMGRREQDVSIVRSIRRVAGRDCYLQADANDGYKNLSLARDALDELYESGLDCIEDPLAGSLEEVAQLRQQVAIPIMLDEPARSLLDIARIGQLGSADIINLHPCQQGTISQMIDRDALVRSLGMKVVIGGTGFVGPGTRFYQQLASVLGLNGPCGEIGGVLDHGMPENLLVEDTGVRTTAEVALSNSSELAVDLEKVKRYAISTLSA